MRDEWVRPKPGAAAFRRDAIGAVLVLLGACISFLLYTRIGMFPEPAPAWLSLLTLGIVCLPLALRRRYPSAVAVVVAIGFFVGGQFAVPEALFTSIGLFIALYSVGAWEQDRRVALLTRLGITLAMFVWITVNLIRLTSEPESLPGLSRSGLFSELASYSAIQVFTNLLYFGGAFFFGSTAWRAARTRAQLRAQSALLDEERQTSAAQAVALDRLEIARELHDVVAHHVSVMGIHAGAARRVLDRDPGLARESLELVEDSAHQAVTELRGLLHTLRAVGEAEAEDASVIGLAGLSALVHRANTAGAHAELLVIGTPRPVPQLVDVALYRVAQEGLTNVRKHAGAGATATVRLRFTPDAVELDIADDGILQRRFARESSGFGLRGMRERIGAVGGSLTAARREQGGFLVRAAVPVPPAGTALRGAGIAAALPTDLLPPTTEQAPQ